MFNELILRLTKRLYPKGRAFKMPPKGLLERMNEGLIISENQALTDSLSVLDGLIPDNDNFTSEDATEWERRLGLINNLNVSLSDRKMSITRKMSHPGTIKARQHYLYLQRELRNAGFDVYVHENRFFEGGQWITKDPTEILGPSFVIKSVHRTGFKHGKLQHGTVFNKQIVNNIDVEIDKQFVVGNNQRSTFFICGQILGDFADIDSEREEEFRQLVLKIKPVQTVAYIFINYI